jgi:hypothetical protein
VTEPVGDLVIQREDDPADPKGYKTRILSADPYIRMSGELAVQIEDGGLPGLSYDDAGCYRFADDYGHDYSYRVTQIGPYWIDLRMESGQ